MSRLIDHRAACSLRLRDSCASRAIAIVLTAAAISAAVPAAAQEAPASTSAEPAPTASDAIDLEAGKVPVPPPPAEPPLPQVDAIIPDAEFNSSIPSLDASADPELDKPLESIEAFERRVAEQQSGAKPEAGQAAPLGDPALADGDTAEEVGDAPVRDAELNAPLPPIDQFEVTPVQFAEDAGADEKNVEVRYRVDLQGLDLADKETETSLKGEFDSFSALKKGDGKAANTAMISARLTEDSQLMETVLASEGWYSPSIRTRLDAPADQANPEMSAVIAVTPGKRYVFSDIVLKADPTEPPNLVADNFALKVGEPIVAERVQGAEAKIAVALPENGYPFAVVGQRDILLDKDTAEGVYTLPVTIGPRGRFGGFTTDGDLAFDGDHIKVLARFKHGELYDSRKVDDLRKALVATSLFSTVSVEPRKTDSAVGDGTQYVDLYVKQDAGPPRTISGSLGYAAGEGVTAQATWTHRNMFPPEGALIGNAILGTRQQGAGVTFRRSNAGKRDRTFELVAEAFHNDYDAYSAYTGRIAARIARDSTPIWQKRYTYAYGVEFLATAETDYDVATGDRKRNTYYVAGLNGQVGFDTSDDLLNPTKGYRLTALLQPEATMRDGFDPYFRARLDASTYYSVSDALVLAARLRLGTIQGAGLFDIAPSRRLYAGGGGSVRGYAYQALGEQAPDGDPVGGRSLNEGSFEARYRFGNYGVVAFVDAGQAYRETMPQFSDLRYGVGIGGRFYTNFGPVRLDLATPLGRKPGESRFNIYVSIGQAF
ncbi:autotransporter assembly complex family protein [Novosphingobium sp. AP12]|uniref:autotransporter assembly complex protein TamA n=1 Tax=Novosphingobium sp. AP12 TaxID=1144305 RepID=UPI000271F1CB|nr:BamA/TamA family outer membrane protein [Novosphingobium sp. AP12]EJL23243.1 outer membrane protein [Novosphingobium sp. AP12]